MPIKSSTEPIFQQTYAKSVKLHKADKNIFSNCSRKQTLGEVGSVLTDFLETDFLLLPLGAAFLFLVEEVSLSEEVSESLEEDSDEEESSLLEELSAFLMCFLLGLQKKSL